MNDNVFKVNRYIPNYTNIFINIESTKENENTVASNVFKIIDFYIKGCINKTDDFFNTLQQNNTIFKDTNSIVFAFDGMTENILAFIMKQLAPSGLFVSLFWEDNVLGNKRYYYMKVDWNHIIKAQNNKLNKNNSGGNAS